MALRAEEAHVDELERERLEALTDPAGPRRPGVSLTEAARMLNVERFEVERATFRAQAVPEDVADAALGDGPGAARAAWQEGRLLAGEFDGRCWFPDWQFDNAGVREGVEELVGALYETGWRDAIALDRLVRTHEDPDGIPLVTLVRQGRLARAAEVARRASGGF